ncbi:MAG: hypothetical protein LBG22_07825 [Treponema sp.]|jgi:xylan 1,4-beta-xylosidase|nr:hypothetical protein [Treponema sp.]
MKEFRLDVQGERTPLEKYWEFSVGSCHAVTGLRTDWQEMLRRCRETIGFRYIRFHGLFDDAMSVVKDSIFGDDDVEFSFVNIDKLFDFLLSIGMKPFVELGFMPWALASGDKSIFYYKANTTPPKSYEQWAAFIGEFIRHILDRYGMGEVRQWFFEVWNEPNLGGPDSPSGFWSGDQAEYFKLYKVTAEAVKREDPVLKTGGPATSNNAWIPEFISFCQENGAPLDFITTHQYPTDAVIGYGVENRTTLNNPMTMVWTDQEFMEKLKTDKTAKAEFKRQYADFQEQLWKQVDRGILTGMVRKAFSEAKGLPLYYTEWASMGGPASDGPFCSSFITKTVLDNRGLVSGYSFWTFCDIFEEQGQDSRAFHGQFGLITQHGIPKASFRAFELLHRLGGNIYTAASVQNADQGTVDIYAAEKAEVKAIQLLAVNHHSLGHPINDEQVKARLTGCPSCVRAEIERVDETHANAFGLWQKMGSPDYLTEAQIFTLKAASCLVREDLKFEQNGSIITLDIDLPPMGIALVTFYWKE